MIVKTMSAFFATIFFSIIFNIAKKNLIFCGLGGAIGWFIYLCCIQSIHSPVLASFLGALTVAIFSRSMSKIRKVPVTIFLISGIIPLVPGAGMYRTMFAIINNDLVGAATYGISTLQIAGVIAIAMVMVSSFPNKKQR
ncbi:MAG: threonine/serine exporter [Epulopiscium sp.]|nr:threonine/serine exporter [Candidatus Epulonipiscium sp.]